MKDRLSCVLANIRKYNLEDFIRHNFKGCLNEFGLEDTDKNLYNITFDFLAEPIKFDEKSLKDVENIQELFSMSIGDINQLIVNDRAKKIKLSQ